MLRNRYNYIFVSYLFDVDILDLFQVKGYKELVGFFFNDFLFLVMFFSSVILNFLFDVKIKVQYRMYKSVSIQIKSVSVKIKNVYLCQ